MEVLVNGKWKSGFLDEALRPGTCRISVEKWRMLEPVSGLYFVRERSMRLLLNYLLEVGARGVIRKVRSRFSEKYRNEKYISVGIGKIIENRTDQYDVGDKVYFIAPIHPLCLERLVLPYQLLWPTDGTDQSDGQQRELAYCDDVKINNQYLSKSETSPWWKSFSGWHLDSGLKMPEINEEVRSSSSTMLQQNDFKTRRLTGSEVSSEIREFPGNKKASFDERPTACLMGYGNYAKVLILPNIRKHLKLSRIHEIDPLQISPDNMVDGISYDTLPNIREGTRCDVYFVAGYHHTHAELALEALSMGSVAVVEKPLLTREHDYLKLIDALQEQPNKLFTCYQRRYSSFNAMIKEDLKASAGDPLDYHCIVYDVPNPQMHWYTWPNSRTKVIENMCHWVDHFMFLNDYVDVQNWDVAASKSGIVDVTIELVNGAYFSMVHTENGSNRIGVSDYIEVRANGRTARIIRSKKYESESSSRILRKAKEGRMNIYRRMYEGIASKIPKGEGADSLKSVMVLNKTLLQIDAAAEDILRKKGAQQFSA